MKKFHSGIGFDAHRFAKRRRLVLGGVRIQHEMGLTGHSDADVLCHAIIDALLGAVAGGDIGKHFPDSDPKWKDSDSIDLLKRTMKIVSAHKAVVVNIDATIIAENPRLASYIDKMRKSIADVVGIKMEKVSIKAKTTEGMGFIGRNEGIAVMSVATVEV